MDAVERERRKRLHQLAGRVEGILNKNAAPVYADGGGTWIGALRAIAANDGRAAIFADEIGNLLQHVKIAYPEDI